MEFLPEYGLALTSGTVALFCRANGALAAIFTRKIAIQADTLNAVVLALKCRGTDHGKRMKGVAQGLLQASKVYSCFTKQEQNAIENILGRI